MHAATQQWKTYMQKLATENFLIGLSSRPFAFVASSQEFAQRSQDFDGGFILWADTENILTTASPVHGLTSKVVRLNTAFTVMKKTEGDNDFDAFHLVQDACEALAWQLLHKMEIDAEPGGANCEDQIIDMVDFENITLERDGPYFNEYYGCTVRLVVDVRNAIPPYNPDQWN